MTDPAGTTRVAAVVLAAGRSSRMGGVNKLVADLGGEPMVARVVALALATALDPVVVVTGYDAEAVRAALDPRVRTVHNVRHREGIGSSVAAGIAALDPSVDGALICLGDMPGVSPGTLESLLEAFRSATGPAVCVPVHGGRRGNPVLWGSSFFSELAALSGDRGARRLMGPHAHLVRQVAVDDPGVLMDVDTGEALEEMRALGRPPRH